MTKIKTPLVCDIAYNNVSMSWDAVNKKDMATPPDWNKVDFDLVKGVICKSSQSYVTGTYEDTTFGHNWRELARVSKPRGAYHFYSKIRPAAWQAKEYVAILKKYGGVKAGDVLVLDAETEGMSISALIDFVYNVDVLTGIKPLIYSTASLLNNLNFRKLTDAQKSYVKQIPLWIAGYPNSPDLFPTPAAAGYVPDQSRYGRVVLWQYDSEVPNVGNIPGGMDVNWVDPAFLVEWQAWSNDTPPVKQPTEDDLFSAWYYSTFEESIYGPMALARAAWMASAAVKRNG